MNAKPKSKAYLRAMRTRGYQDGISGREAALSDSEYRQAWKQGVRRREELGIGT